MNGGDVILADEPTGIHIAVLRSCEFYVNLMPHHYFGHTRYASCKKCNAYISDGEIISDRPNAPDQSTLNLTQMQPLLYKTSRKKDFGLALNFRPLIWSFPNGSMNAHRMRTFLTMLGIIMLPW